MSSRAFENDPARRERVLARTPLGRLGEPADVANAALFSIIEIFLAKTPTFVWVYPWWGAFPVFITVYIPFFVVSFLCYDWPQRTQKIVISALAAVDILALVVFAGILHWI